MLPTFDPMDVEAGKRILEDITSNFGHIQQQVLQEILNKNANTEYLKGFLDGQTDKELFKRKVPVIDYEDIRPYVERIANDGEPSEIITAESITELLLSSGTSGGRQKWIPKTIEERSRRAFFLYLMTTSRSSDFEGLNMGKRVFFTFISPDIHMPSGLVLRTSTTSDIKSQIIPRENPNIRLCEDTMQSMYCQLLSALLQRDEVGVVGTFFASGFLRIIKFLEEHWQELCSNIRTGKLSDWITDPNCTKAISLTLSDPMPGLADSIASECHGKSWEGIVKKLWPKTKVVMTTITGSMQQYIPALDFYTGGLPLFSPIYGASEGLFALNLNPPHDPYNVLYTLIPNVAYYEFLPVDNHEDADCTSEKHTILMDHIVDHVNVKIGQHYELLVTTFTGLYRYRMGDILMVTGFHNNAPQFKYVQRRNVVLSIDTDKTMEEDLHKAVTFASRTLEPQGFFLTDYTSYADMSLIPGHYVLFWELERRGNKEILEVDEVQMEECCGLVEQSLDLQYKRLRNQSNTIGPLEIRVVKRGTFYVLMDFYISRGTSFGQYKTPKSIKPEKAIEILNSSVVGAFFSKVLPSEV